MQNSKFNLNENFKLNLHLKPGVGRYPAQAWIFRLTNQSENMSLAFWRRRDPPGCAPMASWAHTPLYVITPAPLRIPTSYEGLGVAWSSGGLE